MNDRLTPKLHADPGMLIVFAAEQAVFKQQPYPGAAERLANLRLLKRQLHRDQGLLADAMSRDFGIRAPGDSKILDGFASKLEINHARVAAAHAFWRLDYQTTGPGT